MERLTLPTYRKAINILPGRFGNQGYAISQHTDYWDEVARAYPVNMSTAANAGPISPPYVGSSGSTITYPYTGTDLDEKLRAQCTLLLCEKARNRPVIFGIQTQTSSILPKFTSHSEFSTWVTDKHLPLVEEMAKASEIIKAEFLDPYPGEVEIVLNRIQQPGLDTGTSTLVSTANNWISRVKEKIRPTGGTSLFSGRLVGRSAPQFESGGYNDGNGGTTSDGSFWASISYAGYDEIHFALTSNCSTTYFDTQLTNFKALAGSIPWYIAELWMYSAGWTACGGASANAKDTYLTQLFTKMDAITGNKPLGVGIDINPDDDANTLDSAALTVITQFFNSH
jgi:hypothetical protein